MSCGNCSLLLPSGFTEKLPPQEKAPTSSNEYESLSSFMDFDPQFQIVANQEAVLNRSEEEYVQSWENLRDNIQDLNTIFTDLNEIVQVCATQSVI